MTAFEQRLWKKLWGHAAQGIAIGPILFLVAIIGILATAIGASSNSWIGSADPEKAKTAASAIQNQCITYRVGFQRLRANGCLPTEINPYTDLFQTISGAIVNAANPGAAAGGRCDIFSLNSGIIPIRAPSTSWVDESFLIPANWQPGTWAMRRMSIVGIGSSADDIVGNLGNLNYETCVALADAIQQPLTGGSVPTETSWGSSTIWTSTVLAPLGDENVTLAGRDMMIIRASTTPDFTMCALYCVIDPR